MIQTPDFNRNQSFYGLLVLLIFSIAVCSLNFLNFLPDYNAYHLIFSKNFSFRSNENYFFIALIYFFHLFSDDYKFFRIFLICIQFILILIIQKNSCRLKSKNTQSNLFTFSLLTFYILTAGFISFSLQIRDSIAILLVFNGFIFWVNKSRKLAYLYFTLSFFTHRYLFLAFSIFLIPSLIQAKVLVINKKFFFSSIGLNLVIGFLSFLLFFIAFLWQFQHVIDLRSKMNVYRLFLYFFLPIIFFTLIYRLKEPDYKKKIMDIFFSNYVKNFIFFLIATFIFFSIFNSDLAERFVRVSALVCTFLYLSFDLIKSKYERYFIIFFCFINGIFGVNTIFFHIYNQGIIELFSH
jgi:hypothetical protein